MHLLLREYNGVFLRYFVLTEKNLYLSFALYKLSGMQTSPGKLLMKIVLRFFLLYFALLWIYNFSLQSRSPDYFTLATARQTAFLYRLSGMHPEIKELGPAGAGIMSNGKWVVRVVEGCNGISVIIVFLAFVWAFPAPLRDKIRFSLAGIVTIWAVNVLRISLLGWVYIKKPESFDIFHRVIFPAIIYGLVVILWTIWMRHLRKISA